MLDSIYYRRMFGRSNRAPFSPIKMNDSVSRRDCGVPGNGSDVTHGRAAATPPRCRARASVCFSVARFVYWNRLFVFDPDGTLSTPVDFVPFTRDRSFRSFPVSKECYISFFPFFFLSFLFFFFNRYDDSNRRIRIGSRSIIDREVSAESKRSRIKRERVSLSFFPLFSFFFFLPLLLTIDRSCTSIRTRARGRDLFKFSDGH